MGDLLWLKFGIQPLVATRPHAWCAAALCAVPLSARYSTPTGSAEYDPLDPPLVRENELTITETDRNGVPRLQR